MGFQRDVELHYQVEDLLQTVFEALRESGKDLKDLKPADLAPVDEFHIRGREATEELLGFAKLQPGDRVLDVGCGIGGTARHLAVERGCDVTGLDLTAAYCQVARELSAQLGIGDLTRFAQGSALELPFDDQSFDVVWTEHAQMNIEDKARFYAEAERVLRPGGKLVFHDIFQGSGGSVRFPVPWAPSAELSFLATPDAVRALLEQLRLRVAVWQDTTAVSTAWYVKALDRIGREGRPPLGLHLLMGPTGKDKFMNALDGLQRHCLATIEAVVVKER